MFGKRLATLQWLRQRSTTNSIKFTVPWTLARAKKHAWFFTEAVHVEESSKPWIRWMRVAFAEVNSKWVELTIPAEVKAWKASGKPLTEISSLQQLHQELKSKRVVDRRNSDLDYC